MSVAKVFVPATVGNVGPGFDVLGLALDAIGDEIELSLDYGPSRIVHVSGRDADLIPTDPERNVIVRSARTYLKIKGADASVGVRVSLSRQLPVSGGLGSSAAAAVGGALAAAHALGVAFTDQEILSAALEGEAMVAGRHLDNIAPCYFGGLTLVQGIEPPLIQRIPVHSKFHVAVLSPRMQLSTKLARGVLPDVLPTAQWTKQMAMSVGLAVGLSAGNVQLVKDSFNDFFAEPARAHLIPDFRNVKDAALGAGALGCSISGAGPSIFALCDSGDTAKAVSESMTRACQQVAAETFVSGIAHGGARKL
ncbi:MAG: homoserine kinase [Proteobacteria bacterium]|nr:homoserine kinase [Pseudomonadota bacterium]